MGHIKELLGIYKSESERGDWTVNSMVSFQIGATIRRQNKW